MGKINIREGKEPQNNVKTKINEQKLVMNALWLENSIEFLPITSVRLQNNLSQ